MPAAGWCKTIEHVTMLAKVPVITHIMMGSFTISAREGNIGGTNFFVQEDGTSFNSLGLPNGGIEYLKFCLRKMIQITHDAGKLAVINIAGDSPEEYLELAAYAFECGADIVEFNFGCPNKFSASGIQSEIASYNIDLLQRVVRLAGSEIGYGLHTWFKLSPYANPEERVRIASFIASITEMTVDRITTCNTFPNCVPRNESGALLITAKNTGGRAGMAGTGLRSIALANAEHFHALLPHTCGINFAGGASSGKHLAAAHQIGCRGVQIGTAFFEGENFRIFERVATEFLEIQETG